MFSRAYFAQVSDDKLERNISLIKYIGRDPVHD